MWTSERMLLHEKNEFIVRIRNKNNVKMSSDFRVNATTKHHFQSVNEDAHDKYAYIYHSHSHNTTIWNTRSVSVRINLCCTYMTGASLMASSRVCCAHTIYIGFYLMYFYTTLLILPFIRWKSRRRRHHRRRLTHTYREKTEKEGEKKSQRKCMCKYWDD